MDSKFYLQEKKCLRNHVKSTTFSTCCTRSSCDINTDNSLELIKACLNLNATSSGNKRHRRASFFSRVEEWTSALSAQSGLHDSWWREAMACRCSVRQRKADVKTPYERRYGTFLEGPIIPFGASFLCTPFQKDKGRRHSVVPEYSQAYLLGVPRLRGVWTRDLPMWTRKKFK